jgi:hypothetical protein
MSLLFWGITIGVIGKILIAIGILRVHFVMALEQRIDTKVIQSFRFEKILTLVGIALIIVGYILELYFYGLTPMLTCHGNECAQAASVILAP